MKGLFDRPRYRWDGEQWVIEPEDLRRLWWVLPLGTLARVLKPGKARPRLRLVKP